MSDLTGQVIGAAIEMHRHLGPGFVEAIYEQALVVELQRRGLVVDRQVRINVVYCGVIVGEHVLDLVVADTVIVELKAVRNLEDIFYAVVRSYLKASGRTAALLLNFAKTTLEIKRIYPHCA